MKKIILIQDVLTNILLAPVIENNGFEVIQTSSFEEAKKNLESGTNDECFAVIVDLNLEDTKDFKVVDYMCNLDIRTIIYSTVSSDTDIDDMLKKPIVDYVIKKDSEDITFIAKILTQLELYSNLNILIVNDDDSVISTMENFIKPLAFNNIFTAKNGIEALEVIKQEKNISLVITNFHMKIMDGLELIQNIKKIYSSDKLAIISTTQDIDTTQYIQFLKFGVNSFLKKPYIKNFINTIIHNEMEHLFEKQKTLQHKKDLGAFVRKIKTDNMTNNRKHEQDIVDLSNANTILERERDNLKKDQENLKIAYDLMKTKLNMKIDRLSQKKGVFVANEIDNSKQ